MSSRRAFRFNVLLKKEIGQIFLKEFDFSGSLVTITRVDTSDNLIDANIFISVLPDDSFDKIFKVINRNIYDIQQTLNKRLRVRPIPKIKFIREKQIKEADNIEKILKDISE